MTPIAIQIQGATAILPTNETDVHDRCERAQRVLSDALCEAPDETTVIWGNAAEWPPGPWDEGYWEPIDYLGVEGEDLDIAWLLDMEERDDIERELGITARWV